MNSANRPMRHARGNTFAHPVRCGTMLLALSASLGATFFLSACGDDSSNSGGGNRGGSSGFGGSISFGSTEEGELDADAMVEAADEAAALSEEELSAALAAADLDLQMAMAGPSGLIDELGGEVATRAMLGAMGLQVKAAADSLTTETADTQQTQAAPGMSWPGVRTQADGAGTVGEAFGAGWLGGSLFNSFFVQNAINDYSSGKSGIITGSSPTGEVTATGGLSDTDINLDANAVFTMGGLSTTIKTRSRIPCPDATGLMTIDSSLDIKGEAGDGFQSARFTFELIVDVDDDAKLTGRNQLKSTTKAHTANSKNGYNVTDGTVDLSITEFADGHFGDPKGNYKGMTEKEATSWMTLGMMSGILYRQQLLPNLQKMLDAGRCVEITVEPSAGPMNLDPLANVDLLTKPRAKISNSGNTTGGTVQAKFKANAGGAILEAGEKVEADATFHYVAPLDYDKTETLTFEARSKRGTGKLDYTLTTSPHAD